MPKSNIVHKSPMFASDNASGVHPLIMEALIAANDGHALGYGADTYTTRVNHAFKELFGSQAETFLVFNGTAANVIALKGLLRSYEAVFCSNKAHLWTSEAGAPEQFLGAKLIPLPSYNGKINVEDMEPYLANIGAQHSSQPRVISITQCTEQGTIYSPDELGRICDFAKCHKFYVHVDGARIHNAVAALGKDCQSLFTDTGVDIVSFGGTKNGMMMGEAVVVLNPKLLHVAYPVIRKHGTNLASKMRFLSAQYLAYFESGLWLDNARHANAMAAYLAQELQNIPAIKMLSEVEANMLFAELPNHWIEPLQEHTFFHVWKSNSSEGRSEARFVMSFDIIQSNIDDFITRMQEINLTTLK